MAKEFSDQTAYRNKWGKLTKHLSKVLRKKVHGYADLGGSGFFGEVIIFEDNKPDFERKKSLHFYVSIIGPFFSIHGIDSSNAILQTEFSNITDKGNFEVTHAVTVSPVFEYREPFLALEKELRAFFPGYRFLPYDIGMSTMKNISIADELRDPRSMNTIYEAVFGQRAVHACYARGDHEYGMDDWIKSLNEKEKLLADRIAKHINNAPDEITIHKVWKRSESKRLPTFKTNVSMMFGIALIDLMDLTDKSKVIITTGKSGAPSAGKYTIKKDIIKLNPNLSFRIVNLTKETMTLNMILNFEGDDVALKGEAMEMKFVQMKSIF